MKRQCRPPAPSKASWQGRRRSRMARRTMAGGVALHQSPDAGAAAVVCLRPTGADPTDRGGRGACGPSRFTVEHTHHAAHRGGASFTAALRRRIWMLCSPNLRPNRHARPEPPSTREEVLAALAENRLKVYHRKRDPQAVPTLGDRLKTEEKPEFSGYIGHFQGSCTGPADQPSLEAHRLASCP